ncbi:MAG TPA: invasion associated locus B family protein [Devosiaceae bacterium]
MTTKSLGAAVTMAVMLTVSGMALPAVAQEAKSLGTFSKWTAWQGADSNGMICYISAAPDSSQPAGVNRDPVHFLVIHRKGLGTKNEVQTLIGYPYNAQSPNASAAIDGKNYPMITEGSAAWLASAGDEGGFVNAMKGGSSLVVKGTSQRGTNTSDTYSLAGVTAAMSTIDKACS